MQPFFRLFIGIAQRICKNAPAKMTLKREIWRDETYINKKLASYSHRTATTKHPCYIPVLGDSSGAGRIRLTSGAKVITFCSFYLHVQYIIQHYAFRPHQCPCVCAIA